MKANDLYPHVDAKHLEKSEAGELDLKLYYEYRIIEELNERGQHVKIMRLVRRKGSPQA